jgi:hypothetical protein
MRRRIALILGVTLAAGLLGACGGPDRKALDDLRAAVARTERLAHRFEYIDEDLIGGTTNRVVGVVEDDLRYKVRLEVNGEPAVDEVVYDDAVADRFYNTDVLRSMARKTVVEAAPSSDSELSPPAEVREALLRSQWVLDPAGAPPLFDDVAADERQIGDDPIVDAQTVFQYINQVTRQQPVRKFNPDALDYKPKEDPFPKPSRDSDIVRYDFFRFPVPKPSDGAGAGRQAVPGAPSFRKMSVYVKDGVVIRVLEVIDVVDRLDDIERNYEVKLEGTTQEKVKTAIDAINAVRRGQGERQNIRVRKLDFKLTDLGTEQRVTLPEVGIKGSLVFLNNRGKVKAGSSSAAPAVDPAATTPAATEPAAAEPTAPAGPTDS